MADRLCLYVADKLASEIEDLASSLKRGVNGPVTFSDISTVCRRGSALRDVAA